MSAYNKVNGEHAAQHRGLLTDILRTEWGFDGFVVSDWFGVHEAVSAANAGLNIEMPAPVRVYGKKLEDAVERGNVDEAQVDLLVRDILMLANRVKADERDANVEEESADEPSERALTRRAATAGTVLLRNDPVAALANSPVLPLDASNLTKLAVLGPNANIDRSMGGGSASLVPLGHRTLLDALTDRIGPDSPTGALVTFEPGVRIDRLTPVILRGQLRQPNGEPGLRVEYVNGRDWNGGHRRRPVRTDVDDSLFWVDARRSRPTRVFHADQWLVHPRHRRSARRGHCVDGPIHNDRQWCHACRGPIDGVAA